MKRIKFYAPVTVKALLWCILFPVWTQELITANKTCCHAHRSAMLFLKTESKSCQHVLKGQGYRCSYHDLKSWFSQYKKYKHLFSLGHLENLQPMEKLLWNQWCVSVMETRKIFFFFIMVKSQRCIWQKLIKTLRLLQQSSLCSSR